jgi:hypothetical protein
MTGAFLRLSLVSLLCLALPACECFHRIQKVELPQTPNGNFAISISNQSLHDSTVDITFEIDGQVAVSEDFEVGNQHNYRQYVFQLDKGPHWIRAVSLDGNVEFLGDIEVGDAKQYAHLDYWYAPEQERNAKPQFMFTCRKTPIPLD